MLTANRIRPYSTPWRLFSQMQQDFSRDLSDWIATASALGNPPLGVWTKQDEALVVVELPGVDPAEIEVSVHRDVLTIETKGGARELPEGAQVLRRERTSDGMKRQVQLPFELDPQKVDATHERGLLVLRLAAHESAQPAKIVVKAG